MNSLTITRSLEAWNTRQIAIDQKTIEIAKPPNCSLQINRIIVSTNSSADREFMHLRALQQLTIKSS